MRLHILTTFGIIAFLNSQTLGYPSTSTGPALTDENKQLVYLNITVHHKENGNYTYTIDVVPVDLEELPPVKDLELNLRQLGSRHPTPPPGGLLGSIESFMKVIPSFPGAVVETAGNLAVFLPELLGVNVTQIVTSTVEGVRTKPLRTAVTALNNVAFCNPIIAGLNYGRCKGFFATRDRN